MKFYTNSADAISDLHRKGFVNDFQLTGNDLLCIQEGIFIRPGEFCITEYYRIPSLEKQREDETIVFGIMAPYHNLKGILLNHYKSYSAVEPPVLLKKLNEFNSRQETIGE